MSNIIISQKKALDLRSQFDAAREDITGDCVRYHYPLLEIWRALDSQYGAALPKEKLESIGIPAREFQELHALGFAMETVRSGGDTPEDTYKRSYLARHRKCLDTSTPDSIGSLLPENVIARLKHNVAAFEKRNPGFEL